MKLSTAQIVARVLAGDSNPTWPGKPRPEPRPPAPDAEIDRIKRSIEVQLDEYEQAIHSAAEWMRNWKSRPRGFRAKRRNHA